MKEADLAAFKQKLTAMYERLTGDITHLKSQAFPEPTGESTQPTHPADLGSDSYEQELNLEVLDKEGDLLQKVSDALARFETGQFGVCEECGKAIPKARLEVLPHTPFCVNCASKNETNP